MWSNQNSTQLLVEIQNGNINRMFDGQNVKIDVTGK